MGQRYGGDVTDVPGIRVGHWTDAVGMTGCTVVLLPDAGAVTSVEVRGAAPGTRETDLLSPDNTVQVAHAVLLSGGSAFGLAAADGVMQRLAERGIGVLAGPALVPIVPAAVLFDLGYGDVAAHPDAASGRAATLAAESGGPCGTGPVGAGAGATVGKLLGDPTPTGLGTASLRLPGGATGGATVGAVAAVNAVGDVVDESGQLLAGPGTVEALLTQGAPAPPVAGTNTTLALVATDAPLTKTQAHRLAVVAHDAYALAIRPVHTPYDGDTVFAVSTGTADPVDDLVLQTAAVEVLASAIRNAVRAS
jgi:L-aminopeptidase/D-esterase-like protein